MDHRLSRRRIVERHIVDEIQSRQHFDPLGAGEDRSARPFINEAVSGQGHNQHVRPALCLAQMPDMTEMQEIKSPVCQGDGFPRRTQVAANCR